MALAPVAIIEQHIFQAKPGVSGAASNGQAERGVLVEYVALGRSGLKISRLVLGCMTFGSSGWAPWVLGEDETRPILHRALDLGINTFDMADMYSRGACEEIVGRALLDARPRHELVLATKIFNPMSDDPNDRGLSRKHVFEGVDGCLRRLGTDYIDLLQLHRFDYDTPLEETLDALNDVVRAGKVRYLGASSMFAWQFMKALGLQRANGWAPFVSMQPHYNLIYREEEREMLPMCRTEGIGVIPWSPLARGYLTRPHDEQAATARGVYETDQQRQYGAGGGRKINERLQELTDEYDASMAQMALAWLLKQDVVTAPIVGTTSIEHLEAAVEAVDISLSDDDAAWLEEPYEPRPVSGHE